MSQQENLFRPFENNSDLTHIGNCQCGKHTHSSICDKQWQEVQRLSDSSQAERVATDAIEAVAIKALFPHEPTRRAFLTSVGKTTAMTAIASVLPMASLQQAAAMDKLQPEKNRSILHFCLFFVLHH